MADELPPTAEQLAYEAKEVRLLLSKELVQQAFVETELQIVGQWERAQTTADREACWNLLQGFLHWKAKLQALTGRNQLKIAKE